MNRMADSDPYWFSNVHLPAFKRRSCSLCLRYACMLLGLGCSVVLMLAEIFVGVTLLLTKDWALRIIQTGLVHTNTPLQTQQQPSTLTTTTLSPQQQQQLQPTSSLPPIVADMLQRLGAAACWVVIGSTGLTLCVMLWDWTKARSIVQSESIPRAFLSTPAFRLWGIKSYTHFCLLSKIQWGRTIRQRFVMMIYFGLQGFTAMLVSIPRLMVYASILLAAKNIPDLATSQQGFEAIQLTSFATLEGILLKAALAIMALSTVVHGLHLIRIVLAGAVCTFSLCYLGRMRKAMTIDLESRITSLVGSTSYRGRNGSQISQGGLSTKNDKKTLSQEQEQQQHSMSDNAFQLDSSITVSFVSEKSLDGRPQPVSELDPSNGRRLSQDPQNVFYQIDLNQQHLQAPTDSPADRPLTPEFRLYPSSSSDAVPLVNLSLSERNHSLPAFSPPPQHVQPSITTTSSNTNGIYLMAPTPHSHTVSTRGQQQTGALNEEPVRRNIINQLGPNNRLAALSFYDDLLKSINSERMIYANQALVDVRQSIHGPKPATGRESHNPSVNSPSIALCSSIPLSYPSCSEYDEGHSTDRPVHPFDIGPSQPRFPTPGSEQDITATIADIYMHPLDLMDIQGGLEINLQSRPGSQESLHATSFRDFQRASRCGSPHSQETIENWRIHVAPSSPVIPAIEFDLQDGHQQRQQSITPTPIAGRYDGYNNLKDVEGEADSRRGTIPIILSSHLQEAAAMYEDDQVYYSMADDLHVPRPFYAYGQGRSQRQGSVQSSVGGYNYSTAASSPSLADSLSNPMYQQQADGIFHAAGGGGYPRAFPPRKGSLPCSISSSVLEDATTPRGPHFVYQQQHSQTQSQNSFLSAHAALPVARTRPRAPSHLSNMVNHADGLVSDAESSTPFQAKRGRVRSQSQGSHSTTNRGSSWDQLGAFKEAQAGYATLIDIPATSVSHMGYQLEGHDDDDDLMLRESVRMSIKAGMSLKEALAIDNLMYRNSMQQQQHSQEGLPSSSFNGEIDDKMVHPLDLSPLILQTTRSEIQQQSYGYPAQRPSPAPVMTSSTSTAYVPPRSHDSPSIAATAQQAWDETCIGLGLTLTTPTTATPTRYQEPHHAHAYQVPTAEDCSLPRRPIPLRYHQLDSSASLQHYQNLHQNQQQQHRRPEMTTKLTSGLTTHTLQSDATLHSGSYSYATSATSSTFVDMSYTNHHQSSYASHYPMLSSNQHSNNHATNDYDQDTTHTYLHNQYYQHNQQHPQQHQLDRQYSYSQHHEQQEFPLFRRDYNNPPPVQRQSSQRNKKNLVVNISPTNHSRMN
ncbi:hypothetical protein BKA57DRAFT_144211 [Linnemannia elongata]|nr:hypothetical protein BKA57DRAFT_144211 [Linnemannia elongata]